MTPDQALARLIFHAGPEPGAFLAMLRPYRGLHEDVLQDLSRALRGAAPALAAETLPRAVVSALWAISHLARSWLDRNVGLAVPESVRLGEFVTRFDYAVMHALEGELDDEFSDWP